MIKDYSIIQLLQKPSPNYSLYKVQKDHSFYLMHEFISINQCDEYNFKIIKKLVTCNNITKIYQKFIQDHKTYFITHYFPSNLLKQQLKQPNQIFQFTNALQNFAKIVQLIEEIHQNKIISRDIRLQTIAVKENELYFYDFTHSQIVKRKERYFQVVGVTNYLAPEFYLEDGYGFQADIWSAGICLYFMLTGSFPFDLECENSQQIIQEISLKCKKGFDFAKNAIATKKGNLIKTNKHLQDLFKKVFEFDYSQRITIYELKKHPVLKKYFESDIVSSQKSELSTIEEQKSIIYSSIFVSMLNSFPCHFQLHKEEIIFDFLQHCSELLMLESPNLISQEVRILVNFSILKVAVLKVNHFLNVLEGKRQPSFKIDANQWEQIKKTPGFKKVKQKIEKKKKILQMLFKAACLNVKQFKQATGFYSNEIPEDFILIKQQFYDQHSEYRQNLAVMFEIEKQIMKKKNGRQNARRSCQNLARLTILCLINRIFKQKAMREDFRLYFKWSKKQSLEDLQQWIESQRISNLKAFVINITNKYMD